MSEIFSENLFVFKVIAVVGTVSAYMGYYIINKSNNKNKFLGGFLNRDINKKFNIYNDVKKEFYNDPYIKNLIENKDLYIENLIENQKSYDNIIKNFEHDMKDLLLKIKIIKNINNNNLVDIKNELKGIRSTILSNTIRINKLESNKQ